MTRKRSQSLATALGYSLCSAATLLVGSDQFVYFGTYTGAKSPSQGIYVATFDDATGKLAAPELAAEAKSPSFLAIAPSKKFLYAVSEGDGKEGGVSSFAIDAATGKLTLLNKESSKGAGPCHVSVDPTGNVLLTANYGSGHVASLPIKADGSLAAPASVHLQGPASNANPKRQAGPHAHSINVDKAGQFAFACDLGCDKVFIYKLDNATGTLLPNAPAFAEVPAGSGPRHFAFHPSGQFAYVNNEMTLTVSGFRYQPTTGALTLIETLSTLPPGESAGPGLSTAETAVHPSGKFVYVSNRGHDTIACYRCDATTGKLNFMECAPALVKVPRNFGIDVTGKWMITAGQNSNSVAVFAIDQETGKITPTGQTAEVGAPVCVRFMTKY
ncbi:MAG: lactonase family protein [Roseimicrobium sp.]